MKNKAVLLNINKLKSHEAVNKKRLNDLVERIKEDGYLKNPVMVENKYFIILDGHHRVAALKRIGVEKIPVFLVNYRSQLVRVYLRRKHFLMPLVKEIVINRGLTHELFPQKTTMHFIKGRLRNINIRLEKLF